MPETGDRPSPTFADLVRKAGARYGLPPRTRAQERRQGTRPRLPADRLSHAEEMTLLYGPDPQCDVNFSTNSGQ